MPILPLKPKKPINELYIAFSKSPNFASWLSQKTVDAHKEWQHHYFNTLCTGPVQNWCVKKLREGCEVDCVDLMIRMREELVLFD